MRIALTGTRLESIEVDHAVDLAFSGGWEVRLEALVTMRTPAGTTPFDPGSDAERCGPLLAAAIGRSVNAADVEESGTLAIGLDDGTVLTVEPDDGYEAWTVTGPAGETLVCLPGGGIAVWSATPSAPTSGVRHAIPGRSRD